MPQASCLLFDTHAHLDMMDLPEGLDSLIERSRAGIFPENVVAPTENLRMAGMLLPGITRASSEKCLEIAAKYDFVRPGVAVHPNSVAKMQPGEWERIVEMAALDEVVAIGETGLDRHWKTTPFELQVEFFMRHIELARKHRLPILIHCREAEADLLPILRKEAATPGLFGIIHAFSSDRATAEEYLEFGFHISFAGSVTYTNKKFKSLREAAKIVPVERLLIETDTPFMTPHPYRGKLEPNEPLMTAYVAQTLAELRETTIEEIAKITTENAEKLFTRP